jgi:hypothetical protein
MENRTEMCPRTHWLGGGNNEWTYCQVWRNTEGSMCGYDIQVTGDD